MMVVNIKSDTCIFCDSFHDEVPVDSGSHVSGHLHQQLSSSDQGLQRRDV